MHDFKIVKSNNLGLNLRTAAIASATVIEAGDFVTLSSGLIIKAVAASTAIAFAPSGSADGETTIQILDDKDTEFEGTADANFEVAMKGTEVDLVGTTTLLIDVGASVTDVLKISAAEDAGTVGSTVGVRVRINKFLY